MYRWSLFTDGNSETKGTATVAYEATEETSYTTTMGVEVGVEYGIEIGPETLRHKVAFSAKFSYSSSNSFSTTTTISSSFGIEVPTLAGYRDSFYVSGTQYVANIPYTADVFTTYMDNSTSTGWTSGVLSNQDVNNS